MIFALSVLLLLPSLFFCTTVAVLTDITRFESSDPKNSPIVLGGDAHSSQKLTQNLVDVEQRQVNCVQESFSNDQHSLLAELPKYDNNNFLGLLKDRKLATNLENRGPVLDALSILSMKRQNIPLDGVITRSVDLLTVCSLFDHYETTMEPLKDCFFRDPALSGFEQSFEVVASEHSSLEKTIVGSGFSADSALISLYETNKSLELTNAVHDLWCKVFDLNALHTVYAQAKNTSVVMCTGNRHNTVLKSWIQRIGGYVPIYTSSNDYRSNDMLSIERAALTEVECKKAARLLSFNSLGTILGYTWLYSRKCMQYYYPSAGS